MTVLENVDGQEHSATPHVANRSTYGSVVDLFCGAGGLSHGFKLEGFDVVAGVDIDEKCRFPFERNNEAPFLLEDVGTINATELGKRFSPDSPRILVGCAPCQPFSKYSQGREDGRWQLLEHFSRLIREIQRFSMSLLQRLMTRSGLRFRVAALSR